MILEKMVSSSNISVINELNYYKDKQKNYKHSKICMISPIFHWLNYFSFTRFILLFLNIYIESLNNAKEHLRTKLIFFILP